MFLGKLVLLGLALLPIVAFGLIIKNILFDKDKIMPTIEDWKEVGLSGGKIPDYMHDDDHFHPVYSPIFMHESHNIYYSPAVALETHFDDDDDD